MWNMRDGQVRDHVLNSIENPLGMANDPCGDTQSRFNGRVKKLLDPRPNALFAEFGDDIPFRFTLGQFFRVSLAVAIRQCCFSQQMVHRELVEQQDAPGLLGFLKRMRVEGIVGQVNQPGDIRKMVFFFLVFPVTQHVAINCRRTLAFVPDNHRQFPALGKMLTLLIQIICGARSRRRERAKDQKWRSFDQG